ncbi:MAG: GNAT family N-acetyltransferase [Chitinophagaceae bacterium]|nr:GNAT family N-acetyltransferase [Chitinophagaceae bacterium]
MEKPFNHNITFKIAAADNEFSDAKNLFLQYAQSLDIDLSFQGFENELTIIATQYNKPTGAVLLAYKDDVAIGCAGIRQFDKDVAELKRMFVQPQYRQFKIGKHLMEMAIDAAKVLGYKSIRLDTLPHMTNALNLYRSFGFYEIQAYRFNPREDAVYMEKLLHN